MLAFLRKLGFQYIYYLSRTCTLATTHSAARASIIRLVLPQRRRSEEGDGRWGRGEKGGRKEGRNPPPLPHRGEGPNPSSSPFSSAHRHFHIVKNSFRRAQILLRRRREEENMTGRKAKGEEASSSPFRTFPTALPLSCTSEEGGDRA